MQQYSDDLRRKLIQAWQHWDGNQQELADEWGVSRSWLQKVLRHWWKTSAAAMRSLDKLEARAALAGKSVKQKLIIQRDQGANNFGQDEAAIQRHVAAMNKLIDVEDKAERARATRAARQVVQENDAKLNAELGARVKQLQANSEAIRELEDRARKASLPRSEYYKQERDALLARAGTTESAAQRIKAAYDKIIEASKKEEGGHGHGNQALRRGILGVKDFFEGSTRGAIIEGTDILVGTSGSGGLLQSAIPRIAAITGLSQTAVMAVGGLTAAFVGLELAGLASAKVLAEEGEQIKNFSLRTGIAPDRVQAFQFAAKAAGQEPEIFDRMTRGLAKPLW